MYGDPDHTDELDDIADCARAAEDGVRRLARLTIHRPSMASADIDVVLAELAGAIAALPQAVAQLGDMLENSNDAFALTWTPRSTSTTPLMPSTWHACTSTRSANPPSRIHRHLDAAHQWTAHIVADDRVDDVAEHAAPATRRPEHRQAPTLSGIDRPPGMTR